MIKIKGIEINEIDDLDFNLFKVREELSRKLGFWSKYEAAISNYEKDNRLKDAGAFFKTILFIGLFPNFVLSLFSSKRKEKTIQEAEGELIRYYDQPLFNVRRFRIKCQQEMKSYKNEIVVIDNEIKLQQSNHDLSSLGSETKNQIAELIEAFNNKRKKKQNKYNFYLECEKKLLSIEKQIEVRESIEDSRLKLEELIDQNDENSKHMEIKNEFEIYKNYGNLLDSISMNLKKIELDKEEKIEEVELIEMINQIELRN